MRVLVTGATGFVGQHLVRLLSSRKYRIYGTYFLKDPAVDVSGAKLFRCDIRKLAQLEAVVREVCPTRVYHLAAQSSPAHSLAHLRDVYQTNFWGTYNVLEAVRQIAPKARVLVVGSGQCYGSVDPNDLPVTECHAFAPPNPYALSKASADLLAGEYYSMFGLQVVRARPFNHTGPGQGPGFVCSDFAQQIAAIELGRRPAVLCVGDLRSQLDFTDVRDVVRAYELLLEKADSGEAYNVASAQAIPLKEIVRVLLSFCSCPIRISVQRQRFRAGGVRAISGSKRKLRAATGWKPAYNMRQTLQDLYAWWKTNLSDGRTGPSSCCDSKR
jgi:GDP-4-dehydro-6-deoxy-D-mannose reductase